MEQDISSNSIKSFENFGCLFHALNLRFSRGSHRKNVKKIVVHQFYPSDRCR